MKEILSKRGRHATTRSAFAQYSHCYSPPGSALRTPGDPIGGPPVTRWRAIAQNIEQSQSAYHDVEHLCSIFPLLQRSRACFFDVVFLSLGNMGTFETHSRPTPLETCRVHAVKRYRTSARGRRSGHCQKFFRRPFPGHRSPEKGDRSPKRVTGHPKNGDRSPLLGVTGATGGGENEEILSSRGRCTTMWTTIAQYFHLCSRLGSAGSPKRVTGHPRKGDRSPKKG